MRCGVDGPSGPRHGEMSTYPRAEHAWLLGMAAKADKDLVLVGARGLKPPGTNCRIVVRTTVLEAVIAA